MTRQELVDIVDRVYATWNQQLPNNQRNTTYNAWWTLLHDLNPTETHTTITQLAIQDNYMPRPAQIRKHTINRTHNWNPPTPAEAWTQLRTIAHNATTGTHTPNTNTHPIILQTIQQLGGPTAYTLHTNNDRELFTKQYEKNLQQHEQQLHQPPTP